MTTSLAKFFVATSFLAFASFAQAGWDINITEGQTQLLASSNSFASEGELRFASQMISTNTPDANGFLYVENVAQYNCAKNSYQLVKSMGFKSWDDQGVSIDSDMGKWLPVVAGTPQQSMVNNLCKMAVADATRAINN